MVVLGNPPYSNFGGLNRGEWIRGQIEDYKKGLNEKKINLDDDYIKFIRFGQWRIEQTGAGILAYISNNSYLDGITHRRMRQSLRETFTDIYVINLHGNSNKGEVAPDGSVDKNVFDIQQGVAIAIFVKEAGKAGPARVHYIDLWGSRETKYQTLLSTDVSTVGTKERDDVERESCLGKFYFYAPKVFENVDEYCHGWSVKDAFHRQQNGIKTDRDPLFYDFDREALVRRIQTFYSEAGLDPYFREIYDVNNSSSYNLLERRERTSFDASNIRLCLYRPFDLRWLYYSPGLTSRPAWDIMQHMLAGPNVGLITTRQTAEDWDILVTDHLCGHKSCASYDINSLFPLYLYPVRDGRTRRAKQASMFGDEKSDDMGRRPNLNPDFIKETESRLGLRFVPNGRGDLVATVGPEDIFHYAYAIFHSSTYRARYAGLLSIDFSRLPLTSDAALFSDLATFGAELVDLHLLRLPGAVPPDVVGGNGGSPALINLRTRFVGSGANTVDNVRYDEGSGRVYISKTHYFEGVDKATWEFPIGGYQVLDKWLKDRAGRTLSFDDLLHYQRVIVALVETQRIMAEIDRRILNWPIA